MLAVILCHRLLREAVVSMFLFVGNPSLSVGVDIGGDKQLLTSAVMVGILGPKIDLYAVRFETTSALSLASA